MAPNIKDVKPWKPKHPKRTNDRNCELMTSSPLPDQENKDQPIVETTATSSKGTQTPLHDEEKTSSSILNLSSIEENSPTNATDYGMIDDADNSLPQTPESPRQPTRHSIVSSPVRSPSLSLPEELSTEFTDGAAKAIYIARKELEHYQLLYDNDFQLWRQQDDYWRVNTIDHLEQVGRDLTYIMSVDARIVRHGLFTLCKDLKDFQNRHSLPTSKEAWYGLQKVSPENEYQKLESINTTTPSPIEHATKSSAQPSTRKTRLGKAADNGSSSGQQIPQIPQSYWGDHRGLLCYEYNDNGWKLVSAWPDLKVGSRFRKYEGMPNYDQFKNMLQIMYRNSSGETKFEIRHEPNWKDAEAVAQSMKLAQQSIRRFLGVGSREPRDRYLPQEIDFIADYIRKDVGHDWQHTPENSKHVNKLIDAVNVQFEGKRLKLSNGTLSIPRPHRAKFGIINKINRDPTILDARGKDVKPDITKKRKSPNGKTQTGVKKKPKANETSPASHSEGSSDVSVSNNSGHDVQHKRIRLILKNQKTSNKAADITDDADDEDGSDATTPSEFTDADDDYDE